MVQKTHILENLIPRVFFLHSPHDVKNKRDPGNEVVYVEKNDYCQKQRTGDAEIHLGHMKKQKKGVHENQQNRVSVSMIMIQKKIFIRILFESRSC